MNPYFDPASFTFVLQKQVPRDDRSKFIGAASAKPRESLADYVSAL